MRPLSRGTWEWLAPCSITFGNGVASVRSLSAVASAGCGIRLVKLGARGGELGSSLCSSEPLFMPQMAAWVRFCTPILRRIVFIWTLTVASAISILRAMSLFEIPFDQAAQNQLFARRKLWRDPVVWCDFHAVVAVARASVIIVFTFRIDSERQECRRKNCFAHHHEFDGLDEYVSARDVNEIAVGARPKCCSQFI